MANSPRPEIIVEGTDDKFSLIHLLGRNGICYPDQEKDWPAIFPKFFPKDSDVGVLKGMTTAIKAGTEQPIGFVLDANSSIEKRWKDIRDRLKAADVEAPTSPVSDGFIGESSTYKTRVGVWIMPDNEHDGNLENFLSTLISENDTLIDHVTTSSDTARDLGASFSDTKRIKAIIRTWLAWQKDPGMSYGRAIQKHYFQSDSAVALRFVAWFKQLYRIE